MRADHSPLRNACFLRPRPPPRPSSASCTLRTIAITRLGYFEPSRRLCPARYGRVNLRLHAVPLRGYWELMGDSGGVIVGNKGVKEVRNL